MVLQSHNCLWNFLVGFQYLHKKKKSILPFKSSILSESKVTWGKLKSEYLVSLSKHLIRRQMFLSLLMCCYNNLANFFQIKNQNRKVPIKILCSFITFIQCLSVSDTRWLQKYARVIWGHKMATKRIVLRLIVIMLKIQFKFNVTGVSNR